MPFNSETYHRNRRRKMALDYLAEARARKEEGDSERVAVLVRLARINWRIYLSAVRLSQIN